MDVFSKRKRSEVMSRIRGRGNRSTEEAMADLFRLHKITGWRRHSAQVLGHPDFYFPRLRIAVFIDGCFWHACGKCFKMPVQNHVFWERKVRNNRRRDRLVTRTLRSRDVRVYRVWEHDLERQTRRFFAVFRSICAAANQPVVAHAGPARKRHRQHQPRQKPRAGAKRSTSPRHRDPAFPASREGV